jgi:hypothetical protein
MTEQEQQEKTERWARAVEAELSSEARRKRFQRAVWGGLALGAFGCAAITLSCARAIQADMQPAPVLEEAPPETWATDGLEEDAGVVARNLPSKPFEGQKRPPCTPPREKEINGGCWLVIEGEVGPDNCGIYYAHAGKCHVPVRQAKRPPTSVAP